jgi:hypothetical protein
MPTYYVAPYLTAWEGSFHVDCIPSNGVAFPKDFLATSPGFLKVFFRMEDLVREYPNANPDDIVVIKEKDNG